METLDVRALDNAVLLNGRHEAVDKLGFVRKRRFDDPGRQIAALDLILGSIGRKNRPILDQANELVSSLKQPSDHVSFASRSFTKAKTMQRTRMKRAAYCTSGWSIACAYRIGAAGSLKDGPPNAAIWLA